MATCRISLSSCGNLEHAFHNDSKMAAVCLHTAVCHTLCAQKQIESSYNNQPPKWQPHAFRQLLCHTLCAQKQIESGYNNQPPKWPCQKMT